jgi:cell wall-associated NlpC family hydrolase
VAQLYGYKQFLASSATPEDVVKAALQYKGLPYSFFYSRIQRKENGERVGRMDCLRFILYVAQDVGFLPMDFDIEKMRRPKPKVDMNEILWEFLRANMTEIPKSVNSLQKGDVLLIHNRDLSIRNREVHHIGLVIQLYEMEGFIGKWMHSEDYAMDKMGSVVEVEISQLDWPRIHSVWRWPYGT